MRVKPRYVLGGLAALLVVFFYRGGSSITSEHPYVGEYRGGQRLSAEQIAARCAYEYGDQPHKVDLVIGITTAPNMRERRDAQRSSWIRTMSAATARKVAYFFIMGGVDLSEETSEALRQESAEYCDLVVIPGLYNHYEMLAMKTRALQMYAESRFKFQWLLKIDDDVLVFPEDWLHEIDGLDATEPTYMGALQKNLKPIRDRKSPWYDPVFPLDVYPLWARGCAYLESHTLVERLNGVPVPVYFPGEDVTMGYWVSLQPDVRYVNCSRIKSYRGCLPNFLAQHYLRPHEMYVLADRRAKGAEDVCKEFVIDRAGSTQPEYGVDFV